MVVSTCGLHGQRVVRLVGLVPTQGTEPATTQCQTIMAKTALETSVRQQAVK